MVTKAALPVCLLFVVLPQLLPPGLNPLAPARAEPASVAIEWSVPSSQAESVIDSLEFDGSLTAKENKAADTKAFPVVIVLMGLVAFEKLSTTIYDIYRESRPGAVVSRKADGTFVVTQLKSLPRGCVIYSYGSKTTECIFSRSNTSEDPSKILLELASRVSK